MNWAIEKLLDFFSPRCLIDASCRWLVIGLLFALPAVGASPDALRNSATKQERTTFVSVDVNNELDFGLSIYRARPLFESNRFVLFTRPVSVGYVADRGGRRFTWNFVPMLWGLTVFLPLIYETAPNPLSDGSKSQKESPDPPVPDLWFLPMSLMNFGLAARLSTTDFFVTTELRTDFLCREEKWLDSHVGAGLLWQRSDDEENRNLLGLSLGYYRNVFEFMDDWKIFFRLTGKV